MSNYNNIRMYFSLFLGDDADAYGDNYPDVVDSSLEYIGGVDEALISEIDSFLTEYPTNVQAVIALNNLTGERHGDCADYPPSLIEFMMWLSGYLKQKRSE
ncbi:hypothetical protein GQQ23_15805 [Pantoea agglomerans]|uniref:hypothetical protein n=1 Tax=Enterobacter agglomerans TaxID=549 RepID=UPI0013C63CF9|nr:hypothetical protein [Pantoea agglomerans]NEG63798.1 hypothetical protein [Pantoea agglomerans]